MRPNRARSINRALVRTAAVVTLGALGAAGSIEIARADTITGEGVLMPRGTTAKQFGGAFCRPTCVTVSSMPTSVRSQAAKLDAAVMASTGPTVVVLFSLSAVAGDGMVADWIADPATAPGPERVWIVTTGNPLNRYGGTQRDRATAIPAEQPYRHLDVVNQYDSVADRPARWGWYSQQELSLSRHLGYEDIDINDPVNLVYRDGNTTYMLVPAKDLRQLRGLRFLRDIGLVSEERYDEIDADRRAKIEADYDRPAYVEQGSGADWANGVEPEALRDNDEEESWSEPMDDGESDVSHRERGPRSTPTNETPDASFSELDEALSDSLQDSLTTKPDDEPSEPKSSQTSSNRSDSSDSAPAADDDQGDAAAESDGGDDE